MLPVCVFNPLREKHARCQITLQAGRLVDNRIARSALVIWQPGDWRGARPRSGDGGNGLKPACCIQPGGEGSSSAPPNRWFTLVQVNEGFAEVGYGDQELLSSEPAISSISFIPADRRGGAVPDERTAANWWYGGAGIPGGVARTSDCVGG